MSNSSKCQFTILDNDLICEHKASKYSLPPNISLHNHDGYEIIFFLSGDVTLYVESEAKKLERGDLIFISPYVFHGTRLTDLEPYERIILNIKPGVLKSISDDSTDLSVCFNEGKKLNLVHLSEFDIPGFIYILDKLVDVLKNKKYGNSILSRAYLAEFMVMAVRQSYINHSQYDNLMTPVLTKIFDYIEDNMSNDITVESMAKTLHHNSDYLSRVFKNTTGDSLKHYINAQKITLAQRYIRQGNSPYDVCFMVGYNNYSSFSRRFLDHTGMSPKRFQQNCRKENFTNV